MDSIIANVNTGQDINVYWQDEVELQLDLNLMYIKSGQKEIEDYVENVSKPEISDYVETEAKPLVSRIVTEIAEPTVSEYIETTVKPEIDDYVEDKKPELQAFVTQAQGFANAAQEAADTATASLNSYVDGTIKPSLQTYVDQTQADANSAATSMEQAALSATAASNYASNASADAVNAAESATHAATSADDSEHYSEDSRKWAEGTDSEVQGLGGVHSSKVWSQTAQAVVAGKQDIATAVNYKNITNCLTSIPQDIKLELNNGVLTLKAGSKVYVPNGAGVFDVVNIASDINFTYTYAPSSDLSVMLFINQSGTAFVHSRTENTCFSGETKPSGSFRNWYNTNENKMYSIGNNETIDGSGFSFPIAKIIQGSDGVTKSIDQVFNGFGFIGSTIFALPGVKGLIPNYRNPDGSLKNIEVTLDEVKIQNRTDWGSALRYFWLGTDGKLLSTVVSNIIYDAERNKNYNTHDNTGVGLICGEVTSVDGRITSIAPKTAFHALDYNDFYNELNNKFKVVSTLPANPVDGTFYYIPE